MKAPPGTSGTPQPKPLDRRQSARERQRQRWEKVKAALISHDPKRIGPLISSRGILCREVSWEGKKDTFTYRRSKSKLLESISTAYFHDQSGTFGPDPDQVYAWLWVALKTKHPKRERQINSTTWVIDEKDEKGRWYESARVVLSRERQPLQIKLIGA